MSDTPRTDDIIEKITKFRTSSAIYSLEQFCRTLEKELTAAREEKYHYIDVAQKATEERILATEQLKNAQSELLKSCLRDQLTFEDFKDAKNRADDALLELATVTEQRDRLAEVIESIIGEAAFEGIPESKQQSIYEALQSIKQPTQ